jgi:hypothetical protein
MPASPDCPRLDGWKVLLGDAVPPQQREPLERHLESCPACRERVDQALLAVVRRFGAPAAAATDPTLAEMLERLYEVGFVPQVVNRGPVRMDRQPPGQ